MPEQLGWKWNRNYYATFEIGHYETNYKRVKDDEVIITYPITCQFSVDFGIYGSTLESAFVFYNLSPNIRSRIWLDPYSTGNKYVKMSFYAGYGENMPLIFSGILRRCISYRDGGSTEFITEMQGNVGSDLLQYGFVNATFTKGTRFEDILQTLLEIDKDLKIGYLTPSINTELPRNKTFIGQTMDLLGREYGGYEIYINNNEFNILDTDEITSDEIMVISSGSGLLGSPKRAQNFVEISMLFEPRARVASGIELLSDSMPEFNSIYKVQKVKHQGVISPVIGGNLTTNMTLWLGNAQSYTPTYSESSATVKQENTGGFKKQEKFKPNVYTGSTSTQWQKPVKGVVTSPYGARKAPKAGASTYHKGIDIGANIETPVYAPANGKVLQSYISGSLTTDYGNFIKIDHGNNILSIYGHLQKRLVKAGEVVTKGQQIATVGNTGNSTGPHLHFGVSVNGAFVNPVKYIGSY